MMGLAVVVTVVCRRSRDASVRESGVVLVGRIGVFVDGRRGASLFRDGRRERSSSGCRSNDIANADDGWRGGIVTKVEWFVNWRDELQAASSFCAQPPGDGRLMSGLSRASSAVSGRNR